MRCICQVIYTRMRCLFEINLILCFLCLVVASVPSAVYKVSTDGFLPMVANDLAGAASCNYRCAWISESAHEVYIRQIDCSNNIILSDMFTMSTGNRGPTDVGIAASTLSDQILISWRPWVSSGYNTEIYLSMFNAKTKGIILSNYKLDTKSRLSSQSIISLATGKYLLIWQATPINKYHGQIYGRLLHSSGLSSNVTILLNDSPGRDPVSAAFITGGFVTCWSSMRGADSVIFASISSQNGTVLGNITLLVTDTSGYTAMRPSVAVLPLGGFVIVWETWPNGNFGSRNCAGQLFDAAGDKVGPEFTINGNGPPYVASASNSFMVTWYDNVQKIIRGLEFSFDGVPLGSYLEVSKAADSTPQDPFVRSWNFGYNVVWAGKSKGGSESGIFGRSYYTVPQTDSPTTVSPKVSPIPLAPTLTPSSTTNIPQIESAIPMEATLSPAASQGTLSPSESSEAGRGGTLSILLFTVMCFLVVCVIFIIFFLKCGKLKANPKEDDLTVPLSYQPMDVIPSTEPELQPLHEISWASLSDFKEVGRGAYGIVWTAWTNITREQIAIKESHNKGEDLLREVGMLCSLRQKNILNYYGWTRNNGKLYMITEYCAGGQLLDYDWRDRTTQVLALIDIARALSYLETLSLVHMDVAARNVLVMTDGLLKLSDMGILSKRGEQIKTKRLPIPWCSPITLQENRAFTSQDIWSYGCLLYEVLSGKAPFHEDTKSRDDLRIVAQKIIAGHMPRSPTDLNAIEQQIWDRIVCRCWDISTTQLSLKEILITMEGLQNDAPRYREPRKLSGESNTYRIINVSKIIYETVNDLRIGYAE